jgi:hypothetical protein
MPLATGGPGGWSRPPAAGRRPAPSGDLASARSRAASAIAEESDLSPGWWLLVQVCLQQRDFQTVAEALSKIEQNLHVQIGDLEKLPDYAEFVKSKEYAVWRQARRKPAAGKERP